MSEIEDEIKAALRGFAEFLHTRHDPAQARLSKAIELLKEAKRQEGEEQVKQSDYIELWDGVDAFLKEVSE